MTAVRFFVNDATPSEPSHDCLNVQLTVNKNDPDSTIEFIVTNFYQLRNALNAFHLQLTDHIESNENYSDHYVLLKTSKQWELHYFTEDHRDTRVSLDQFPRLMEYLRQFDDKPLAAFTSSIEVMAQIKELMGAYIRKQNNLLLHEFYNAFKIEMQQHLSDEFKQAPACLPVLASNDLEEFVKNSLDAQASQFTIRMSKTVDAIVCLIHDNGIGFPSAYLNKDSERKPSVDRANVAHVLQKGKYISDKEMYNSNGGQGKGLALTLTKMRPLNAHVHVGNMQPAQHGYVELSGPVHSYQPHEKPFRQLTPDFQLYLSALRHEVGFVQRPDSPDLSSDVMILQDLSKALPQMDVSSSDDECEIKKDHSFEEDDQAMGLLIVPPSMSNVTLTPLPTTSSLTSISSIETSESDSRITPLSSPDDFSLVRSPAGFFKDSPPPKGIVAQRVAEFEKFKI